MADVVTLEAAKRTVTGKKVKTLRWEGKLPAVIYGAGLEPTPITLEHREASRLLREVTSATIVNLKLADEEHTAIVRERQYDRLRQELMHVDFMAIVMDVTLRARVPLRLVGEAPAVKEFSAMIMAESDSLEVEALPKDLPEAINVDVSGLTELGSNITVADLDLGESVTIMDGEDTVLAVAIAGVSMAEEEEELEEEVEEIGAEPEVIERGKREEDEEEA